MRVELIDAVGQPSIITSNDPELIGRWFAEHAPRHMSADVSCASRIQIWPQSEQDFEVVKQPYQARPFTQEALLELAQVILNAAEKQGALENASDR